jgi:hypothetical protein
MELLAQQRYLWPDPETGPYALRISLNIVNGQLVPTGFEMWGQPPPTEKRWIDWGGYRAALPMAGLEPTFLRKLPFYRIVRALIGELRGRWAPVIARNAHTAGAAETLRGIIESQLPARGRPILYPERHWTEVADVYRQAERQPVVAVADQFHVSRSTARKWAERCRQKGLL